MSGTIDTHEGTIEFVMSVPAARRQ